MPDAKRDSIRPFEMKVRCQHCKLEGEVSSKDWPIRFTGAIEMLCPRCGEKTVYVGVYGHDVDSERQLADLRRSGVQPREEGGNRDGK